MNVKPLCIVCLSRVPGVTEGMLLWVQPKLLSCVQVVVLNRCLGVVCFTEIDSWHDISSLIHISFPCISVMHLIACIFTLFIVSNYADSVQCWAQSFIPMFFLPWAPFGFSEVPLPRYTFYSVFFQSLDKFSYFPDNSIKRPTIHSSFLWACHKIYHFYFLLGPFISGPFAVLF